MVPLRDQVAVLSVEGFGWCWHGRMPRPRRWTALTALVFDDDDDDVHPPASSTSRAGRAARNIGGLRKGTICRC